MRCVGAIPYRIVRYHCHSCGREITSLQARRCSNCNAIFCSNHISPENHNCLVSIPRPLEPQPASVTPVENHLYRTSIQTQPLNNHQVNTTLPKDHNFHPSVQSQRLEHQFEESNLPANQGTHPQIQSKTEQRKETQEKKKVNNPVKQRSPKTAKTGFSKRSLSIIIVIVLLAITSVGSVFILYKNYMELTNEKLALETELLIAEAQIVSTSSSINESRPQLEQLKTNLGELIAYVNLQKIGDTYHLHDPLFSDVTKFITNDTSNDTRIELNNSKEQGLQCAYVIVRTASSPGIEYDLIGFNTTDIGMVYFEPKTDNRVTPVIGSHYSDCVEGTFASSPFDDTITSIFVMW